MDKMAESVTGVTKGFVDGISDVASTICTLRRENENLRTELSRERKLKQEVIEDNMTKNRESHREMLILREEIKDLMIDRVESKVKLGKVVINRRNSATIEMGIDDGESDDDYKNEWELREENRALRRRVKEVILEKEEGEVRLCAEMNLAFRLCQGRVTEAESKNAEMLQTEWENSKLKSQVKMLKKDLRDLVKKISNKKEGPREDEREDFGHEDFGHGDFGHENFGHEDEDSTEDTEEEDERVICENYVFI